MPVFEVLIIDLDCTLLVAICSANTEGRSAASPSVIIIGGGMAGIAAARILQDASFQVLHVLECWNTKMCTAVLFSG